MSKSVNLIDSIIIDTCIYQALNFDFRGQNNKILPSLKTILMDHGIQSISSPIIKSEVLKHVTEKAHDKTLAVNKLLSKHRDIIPLIGIKNVDLLHKRIQKLNLMSEYQHEVEDYFSDFRLLPIPKAEEIFEKYFKSIPPFAKSGDKKSEFPDAFIIQSVLNYANKYVKEVLVVSSDNDWRDAFQNTFGITFVDSLNEAINYIHEVYTNSKIAELYSSLSLEETAALLSKKLKECTFYVDDFYSEVENVYDISMASPLYDICPLSISNYKMIYSAIAPMEITATISVLDESNSLWDDEDKYYIFTEHKSITVTSNIDIYFEAEVSINDDKSVTNKGAVLLKNINNNRDIKIEIPSDY